MSELKNIKAIIGLGNPGQQYYLTRHSIGFRVLDKLADRNNASWKTRDNLEETEIVLNGNKILLIKPMTYMNSSGQAIPYLRKKGIKPEEILVVHDELELPFGQIKFKLGGSAKGHNGLKSIISVCGENFHRLRFGIGRPENREDVPNYVLQPFFEKKDLVEEKVSEAADLIENIF